MTIRISVITVTLNSERYVAQCLASVAEQGNGLHEHIIVDGGSTDATLEIIKAHAASDSRVRWISEPDDGISDAMNKGVTLSTGDVVTHLNSDDYFPHSQVLSTVQSVFMNNPDAFWLSGGMIYVSETGAHLRNIKVRDYSFRRLVRGNILLHPATFIKRETFIAVGGFNLKLLYCMDYDLFLRLGIIGPPLQIDEYLCCFRVHEGSLSIANSEKVYSEEYRVRMEFLEKRGHPTLFYRIDYQIKKRLNKYVNTRLLSAGRA